MVTKAAKLFGSVYKNRKVLVTGHTGFKGSWLALWLKLLGAEVGGYALPPDTDPSHFIGLNIDITSHFGDIRNYSELLNFIQAFKPEIVFHLAAQPIVLESYKNPAYTCQTNIMGTVNLLECCHKTDSVKSIVVVTTDKVYKDDNRDCGYSEKDRLGGFDPYSASKACVELLCDSFRKSFLSRSGKLLATARAGNVIGGGDWAEYRLIPDIIRSVYKGKRLEIRNPHSIRPWQHVLEPLAAYLHLGWYLIEGRSEYVDAWNFGPNQNNYISVSEIIGLVNSNLGNISFNHVPEEYHETSFLMLDTSKARYELGWTSLWDIEKTVITTFNWYWTFYNNGEMRTVEDIERYVADAEKADLVWTR